MQQINVNDQLYEHVQSLAESSGFLTVDEYVIAVLTQHLHVAVEDWDHLFTPERLTMLDAAEADAESGNVCDFDEIRRDLAELRIECNREHHAEK